MAMAGASGSRALRSVVPCLRNVLIPISRAEASAITRGFNTAALERHSDVRDDIETRGTQSPVSRRSEFLDAFSDPFFPFRGMGLGLDQLLENPFLPASRASREPRGAARRPWDAVEDAECLRLRVDMPGLSKEDVKVYAEENSLVIKGESSSDVELDGSGRKYSSRIDLPSKIYKLDEIKAQMKNGVLRVTVPKFKEGEGKNVFTVDVE